VTTSGADEQSLTPARRERARTARETAPADFDDEEVQRGLAGAVLGALGRMQLRLEAIGREQSEAADAILAALQDLERRIGALEVGSASVGAAAPQD
jgi:hypothetical protein